MSGLLLDGEHGRVGDRGLPLVDGLHGAHGDGLFSPLMDRFHGAHGDGGVCSSAVGEVTASTVPIGRAGSSDVASADGSSDVAGAASIAAGTALPLSPALVNNHQKR